MKPVKFVVDASVALKWFIPEEYSDASLLLLKNAYPLFAPDLIFSELGNVLWKKTRNRDIDKRVANTIINAFLEFPIKIYSSALLMISAYELAEKFNSTVYDCMYLACAITEECPLVTADKRFFNEIKKSTFQKNIRFVDQI